MTLEPTTNEWTELDGMLNADATTDEVWDYVRDRVLMTASRELWAKGPQEMCFEKRVRVECAREVAQMKGTP